MISVLRKLDYKAQPFTSVTVTTHAFCGERAWGKSYIRCGAGFPLPATPLSFASPPLMPSARAFGVEPSVWPRLTPNGQDHSARRFGLYALPRGGWSRMLVHPLDHTTSERLHFGLGPAAVRRRTQRCSRARQRTGAGLESPNCPGPIATMR